MAHAVGLDAAQRDPALDRFLIRVGVPDHAARIVAATPSLRTIWLLTAALVTVFALAGPRWDPRVAQVVLLLAPILPVLAVAAAWGPWSDPMFDVTRACPAAGLRVLLLRTIAVVAAAIVLVGVATLTVPSTDAEALTWVLPAFALAASSLMLATFLTIARATLIVIGVWVGLVAVASVAWPQASLQRGGVQLAFAAVAVGASAVVTRRRGHLEIENLRSRRALVDAADAERRRIERNIHDGAQQQLVAIGVKAGLARTLVTRDPGKAIEIIDQVCADAQAALAGLRDMTRGAYPPILADEGLPAALAAKARSASLPVSLDVMDLGRLPRSIEIAVYFCCTEALQNAAKHAKASTIAIAVRPQVGALAFSVIDDGAGFDPATARRGVGMRSMAERVETLGGTLHVRSAPGAGTTIAATIPLSPN